MNVKKFAVYFTAFLFVALLAVASYNEGRKSIITMLGVSVEDFESTKKRCEDFGSGPCIILSRGLMPKAVYESMKKRFGGQQDGRSL